MSIFLLPLVSIAVGSPVAGEVQQQTARAAQVAIVDELADADAIDFIAPSRTAGAITFGYDRDGRAYELVVTTGFRGAVLRAERTDVGAARPATAGALTWLGADLVDASAVTTLHVRDGRVVLVTDDERRYLAVPQNNTAPVNAAAESRWAAAWDAG